MLVSAIPIVIANKKAINQTPDSSLSVSKRTLNIVSSVLLVALFWAVYEISGARLSTLHSELSEFSKSIMPESLWASLQYIMTLPILVVLVLVWTYKYSSHQFKLLLGFIFGAVAYGMLIYLPKVPGQQHLTIYLASLFFLSLSEAHIAPVISSVVTKYSNPKYLAIIFGLVFVPSRILSILIGFSSEELYNNPSEALVQVMIIMILVSLGLAVYIFGIKKQADAPNS